MTATFEDLLTALPEARGLAASTSRTPGSSAAGTTRPVVLVDATHDSRQVTPGTLFCAVPGSLHDGHDHAPGAVEAGAAAVLVERRLDVPVPQVQTPSVRASMGRAAAVIHDRPTDRLQVVGVTGTNGKTTTAYLLESAFGAAGMGAGLIGTIETRIHGESQPGVRTTPEGTDLQRLFARMLHRGVDAVAMEVSSHGLAMHRVDGVRFRVAVFTNLSQDHLDFHGSMEAYFEAKARLFTPALSERAVICVDDEAGAAMAARSEVPTVTFGESADADHRLIDVEVSLDGSRGVLARGDDRIAVATRLPGRFNLRNAAGAVLAAIACGIDPVAATAGVAASDGVPGRLESVDEGQPFRVFVDYAHTPDALDKLVGDLRRLVPPAGRLHLVVGAGGDRDRGKRPAMGRVAARVDRAVLTSDNPRSERPEDILAAVESGARAALDDGAAAEIVVRPGRADAIADALAAAGPDDVVVIAGKGHETGQEFADHVEPFDDREVARRLLREGAP